MLRGWNETLRFVRTPIAAALGGDTSHLGGAMGGLPAIPRHRCAPGVEYRRNGESFSQT